MKLGLDVDYMAERPSQRPLKGKPKRLPSNERHNLLTCFLGSRSFFCLSASLERGLLPRRVHALDASATPPLVPTRRRLSWPFSLSVLRLLGCSQPSP